MQHEDQDRRRLKPFEKIQSGKNAPGQIGQKAQEIRESQYDFRHGPQPLMERSFHGQLGPVSAKRLSNSAHRMGPRYRSHPGKPRMNRTPQPHLRSGYPTAFAGTGIDERKMMNDSTLPQKDRPWLQEAEAKPLFPR